MVRRGFAECPACGAETDKPHGDKCWFREPNHVLWKTLKKEKASDGKEASDATKYHQKTESGEKDELPEVVRNVREFVGLSED